MPTGPARFSLETIADVLPPGGFSLVSGCAAESNFLADALAIAGDRLGPMTFGGIFMPGVNTRTYIVNAASRMLTFFMTPQIKALGDKVDFMPLCYEDIMSELRRRKPDALLFMCAPPDAEGRCSFGVQHDFLCELWPEIPIRIAHINPAMPSTASENSIPFDALTAFCEVDEPLRSVTDDAPDAAATRIARYIRDFVQDGSTLQVGIGKVPGALLRALTDLHDLRVHSGIIGDAVLDLIAAGAMAPGQSATVGLIVGSERLYDAVSRPPFRSAGVSVTHGLMALAAIDKLVSVNSALEVDLFGQAYAEMSDSGLMSGAGGASDFARGARAAGGLRIIALPADGRKGTISRIVAPDRTKGPVSLGRADVDLVITEHGVADLRAVTYEGAAQALIAIAAPQFREQLAAQWTDYARRL